MREGEADWINQLGTMAPTGYNLMRGGSSVGSISNAKPCTIFINGILQNFVSFTEAAKAAAMVHGITGNDQVQRFIGTAHVRRRNNWTLGEALGFEPREDGRSTEISRTARKAGELVDTARSREHRRKLRSERCDAIYRTKALPDPNDNSSTLPPKEVFKILCVSESTGRHRLRQIESKLHKMSPAQILSHISNKQDRTKPVSVVMPDGRVITKSVNELARCHEKDGLGYSAIKARLRKLGPSPTNEDILVALGICHPTAKVPRVIPLAAVSRKKHCSDWTIHEGERSRPFCNQAAFLDACYQKLRQSHEGRQLLGRSPDDEHKAKRSLQARISRGTRSGKSPTNLANELGILLDLLQS